MTTEQIRRILRAAFGARCYRITRDGDIHVYGAMPNTSEVGWYDFGKVGFPETMRDLAALRDGGVSIND